MLSPHLVACFEKWVSFMLSNKNTRESASYDSPLSNVTQKICKYRLPPTSRFSAHLGVHNNHTAFQDVTNMVNLLTGIQVCTSSHQKWAYPCCTRKGLVRWKSNIFHNGRVMPLWRSLRVDKMKPWMTLVKFLTLCNWIVTHHLDCTCKCYTNRKFCANSAVSQGIVSYIPFTIGHIPMSYQVEYTALLLANPIHCARTLWLSHIHVQPAILVLSVFRTFY